MEINDRKRRKGRRDLFGMKKTEEKGEEITNGWEKIFHACCYVSYYRINSRLPVQLFFSYLLVSFSF